MSSNQKKRHPRAEARAKEKMRAKKDAAVLFAFLLGVGLTLLYSNLSSDTVDQQEALHSDIEKSKPESVEIIQNDSKDQTTETADQLVAR